MAFVVEQQKDRRWPDNQGPNTKTKEPRGEIKMGAAWFPSHLQRITRRRVSIALEDGLGWILRSQQMKSKQWSILANTDLVHCDLR